MRIKDFIHSLIFPQRNIRLADNVEIENLQPELSPTELPGPFDYSVALSDYPPEVFHGKSDMGILIRLMKSRHSQKAADRLASFLIGFLEKYQLPQTPEIMVTIPDSVPHRPFQPIAYLSEAVAGHFGWPARHDIINPVGHVRPQKNRSFRERMADTQPRYGIRHPDIIEGKHVLLFDDIYATGQSVIEAANLIREQSPTSIMALTLAKLSQAER